MSISCPWLHGIGVKKVPSFWTSLSFVGLISFEDFDALGVLFSGTRFSQDTSCINVPGRKTWFRRTVQHLRLHWVKLLMIKRAEEKGCVCWRMDLAQVHYQHLKWYWCDWLKPERGTKRCETRFRSSAHIQHHSLRSFTALPHAAKCWQLIWGPSFTVQFGSGKTWQQLVSITFVGQPVGHTSPSIVDFWGEGNKDGVEMLGNISNFFGGMGRVSRCLLCYICFCFNVDIYFVFEKSLNSKLDSNISQRRQGCQRFILLPSDPKRTSAFDSSLILRSESASPTSAIAAQPRYGLGLDRNGLLAFRFFRIKRQLRVDHFPNFPRDMLVPHSKLPMNFQLSEIPWLAVKVLLVYAAHLQYGTLWHGGSWTRLNMTPKRVMSHVILRMFVDCFFKTFSRLTNWYLFLVGNYSLYRQYYRLRTWLLYPSLPSSRKKPCSKLSAKCKRVVCWLRGIWIGCKIVKEWWAFHIQLYCFYFLCPFFQVFFPMYRHVSAVTNVLTEVYHFHGVDHADILDLWCCHVGNPAQTNDLSWYDSMTWIIKAYWILNLGGHFSLAMCIKVNWYLKCNQVDVKTLHTASQYEMFLLALRSCHLGPYWFTTWNLEFELSKERVMACWGVLFMLAKLVVLEFLRTLIPGRHGLCSLECMDYSRSWTTRPCGKYQHWSSSKRVMKMALVSNNPWWPSSSFWCFRRNACST